MEPLKAADVISATRGAASGGLPAEFRGVSTDTRTIAAGDLFVALSGERFEGHRFLTEALARGAAAAIVDRDVPGPAPLPLIRVADTGRALLDLGRFQRSRLRAKVVAITGSNGKTTTKELAREALAARFRVVASPKSFNNFVGVPLTLFMADASTEVVVLEVGTNHPGEIATIAEVARPDVAVITNVAAAHLEGLGSLAGVLEEKGSLLDYVAPGGFAVLNGDDDASIDALRLRAKCRVVVTGVRRRADYVATMAVCDLERIAFHLNGKDSVRIPLLGCHNLYNALAALAVAVELGVPIEAAARRLRTFEGPPSRLKKHQRGERLVIDDAYNANPGSMKAAIKTFAALDVPGRKILVLGDMAELGSESESLHREVGGSISCGTFALVAAVGARAAAIVDGARQHGLDEARIARFADAESCAAKLPARLLQNDAVLVKGSRAMGLERVVKAILDASVTASGGGAEAS